MKWGLETGKWGMGIGDWGLGNGNGAAGKCFRRQGKGPAHLSVKFYSVGEFFQKQ